MLENTPAGNANAMLLRMMSSSRAGMRKLRHDKPTVVRYGVSTLKVKPSVEFATECPL